MLIAAFSSLYHWCQVGNPVNAQRGHWLLSRVFLDLERAEEALVHALWCMELTEREKDSMEDFDEAYAHEGLASAYAFQGKTESARNHFDRARELGELIADDEDEVIFLNDLMGGDWAGAIWSGLRAEYGCFQVDTAGSSNSKEKMRMCRAGSGRKEPQESRREIAGS
ncbi:MAG: tetratricopeptide repeat protein [Anaerolineales bacterium]